MYAGATELEKKLVILQPARLLKKQESTNADSL